MKNVDVYRQYFSAECLFNDIERRGVLVWLNAESDSGIIRYEVGVTFFPHRDAEDYGVSYDACATKELIRTEGRRSKKRDEEYQKGIPVRQISVFLPPCNGSRRKV